MYELWDSITRNMVDTYRTATEAEEYLGRMVREQGSPVLRRFFLSYEGDREEDDALVGEGEAMLVAIKRLATEERAAISPPSANHRQVG